MKRMITLIGATAPLAILAAVGAAPNASAQATILFKQADMKGLQKK